MLHRDNISLLYNRGWDNVNEFQYPNQMGLKDAGFLTEEYFQKNCISLVFVKLRDQSYSVKPIFIGTYLSRCLSSARVIYFSLVPSDFEGRAMHRLKMLSP